MKLAFVNDHILRYALADPAAIGGAERQQWLLARALAGAGWSVTVGVRETLEEGQRTVIDGVGFIGIGAGYILMRWYQFLLAEQPDWLYWRCADHLLGPVIRIGRYARVRAIFSAAYDTDVDPRHALTRRPHWWPLYEWGLAQAERLFIQHGGQLSRLPQKWRSKAYLVPSIAGETRSNMPHRMRQKYVAWVGVLRQHKRPELLIEAASKATDIQFVVCGGTTTFKSPPRYGERIVNALRRMPNVTFLGAVPPAKAQEVIAGAGVLLSTSDGEGFPNTFLQAWSNGTPVVSVQIDPDAVIERAGLGAVSGTIDSAITDLYRLMESSEQRDEIACRARRYIAEHHSEEVVVKAFQHAVGEALA